MSKGRRYEELVHKASPLSGWFPPVCAVCGVDIKQIPGGQGSTWVHDDTGAVAASNKKEVS